MFNRKALALAFALAFAGAASSTAQINNPGVVNAAQAITVLQSLNPNFTQLHIASTSDDTILTVQGLHAHLEVVASQSTGFTIGPLKGAGSAIIGASLQDELGTFNPSFPSGINGYGQINASGLGNSVGGGFFRCDITTTSGWCNGIETDVFNTGADSTWPLGIGIPVTPPNTNTLGIQSVNAASKKSAIAYRAIGVTAPWLAVLYADPPPAAGALYGVYIDATATFGTQNAAILKGVGATPISIVQVTGTAAPTNIVSEILDASNNLIMQQFQSGAVTFGNAVSNPTAQTNLIVTNTHGGTGTGAAIFGQSDAGSIKIAAGSAADGSTGVLQWSGASNLFIQANNGGGIIFRTTAGVTTLATMFNNGGFGVGSAATDPGANNIMATGFVRTGVTVVGSLPSCAAGTQGARYFVTDQNTGVTYHGAVTGGGANKQAVACDGTSWYQD